MARRLLNNELERMRLEEAVTQFALLWGDLSERVEASHKKCSWRPCHAPSASLHGSTGVFALTQYSHCLESRQ